MALPAFDTILHSLEQNSPGDILNIFFPQNIPGIAKENVLIGFFIVLAVPLPNSGVYVN